MLWGIVYQEEDSEFGGFARQSGSYRLQGPMGGSGGGAFCPQESCLMIDCWDSRLSFHSVFLSRQQLWMLHVVLEP